MIDVNYLAHHGIEGQKWGVQNGPPYPLDAQDHSYGEKKAGTSGWSKEARKDFKKDIKNVKNYVYNVQGMGQISQYSSVHRPSREFVRTNAKKARIDDLHKTLDLDDAKSKEVLDKYESDTKGVTVANSVSGLGATAFLGFVNPALIPVGLGLTAIQTAVDSVGSKAVGKLYQQQKDKGQEAIQSLMDKGYGDMTIPELNAYLRKK